MISMHPISRTIALSLLIVILQTTVVRFLAVGMIVPDIVLLWVVYIAITEGRIPAMTAGFLLGLLLDLISGRDGMLGLGALAKTLAAFVAGSFHNENKTLQILGGAQFLLILFLSAVVHHLAYFLIFLQGSEFGFWTSIGLFAVPATLTTVGIGLLPVFVFKRRYGI